MFVSVTIVNDEEMKLMKQIDTCLNTQKLQSTQMSQPVNNKMLLPAMYLRILEHSVQRI